MSSPASELSLDDLAAIHPCITEELAGALAQAAKVCLDRHHRPPIALFVEEGAIEDNVSLRWEPTSARARAGWGDQNDTIEWTAVGVALAFLGTARELVAVRRARRVSGADYYVAAKGASLDDLEGAVRLEISGIESGGVSEVRRRLFEKLSQLHRAAEFTPGIAVVVGFAARAVHLATLDAS